MCYFKPWYSWSLMVALNTREIRGSNPIKPTFLCPILMHGLFTEGGTKMVHLKILDFRSANTQALLQFLPR